MAETPPRRLEGAPFPVFPLACWALGLIAFCQLIVAGLALAVRFEDSREVRIVEKEVPKLVAVRIPAPAPETTAPDAAVVARPPVLEPAPERSVASLLPPPPPPTPVGTPEVADPRSGRLIDEARAARIAGDMMAAITKLEEANRRSPGDPSVAYELGLVHEAMGVFETAAEHYQRVFEMGISKAGSLYEKAAAKLRDGFEQPGDALGKLALGRVRAVPDPHHEEGERVVVDVPVHKAPGVEINSDKLSVTVTFFNRTESGGIVQLEEKSWAAAEWATLPFDWQGGEEVLRVNYVIPRQDRQMEHLFGEVKYFGQVVTLSYGDAGEEEVLDVRAWPPALAARVARSAGDRRTAPEFWEDLPPGFDPEDGLGVLPPLPSE